MAAFLSWFGPRLDLLSLEDPIKDPKTRLQEHQQGNKSRLPAYEVLNVEGPTNEQIFTVECRVPEYPQPVVARGNSRRAAEQQAAQQMLVLLGIDQSPSDGKETV